MASITSLSRDVFQQAVSYHPTNMARLAFSRLKEGHPKIIRGSGIGMTAVEAGHKSNLYPGLEISYQCDALALLRNDPSFQDP
jgi:hypothetical protein